MKASASLNYKVEEVFKVFIKAAKRDFKDFNKEDPIGCKIVKKIYSGSRPMECTVEITDYEENAKYEITTTYGDVSCKSTYSFIQKGDGITLINFEEDQGTKGLFSSGTLWLQRIMAKKQFKIRFNGLIEELSNQLKTYTDNVKKSTKESEEIRDN